LEQANHFGCFFFRAYVIGRSYSRNQTAKITITDIVYREEDTWSKGQGNVYTSGNGLWPLSILIGFFEEVSETGDFSFIPEVWWQQREVWIISETCVANFSASQG